MEQVENMSQDDVLEVILNFPIEPLKNRVIITVNVEEEEDELNLSSVSFAEAQYVIAKGEYVKDFEPGQKILLDLDKMIERVRDESNPDEIITRVKIDPIEVDGRIYAIIYDSVIKAKDNR